MLLWLYMGHPVAVLAQTSQATSPNVGAGITRALATDRAARVSDLTYSLSFNLQAHADVLPGIEDLRFKLSNGGQRTDLLLDYRDGKLLQGTLNGAPVNLAVKNGHLVLPASRLRVGENHVGLQFASRIASSGAAITRYEDKEDGSEYIYTLFVPMDASMAFPCFDQPDLKARFKLEIESPADWTVVSNTSVEKVPGQGSTEATATRATRFAATRPISTYLFAFAAGPWVNIHPVAGEPNVYVRRSQQARAVPEIPQLQEITARGMGWLADYFHQPFPFPKYDIVLIPGFPFGGMEHAGATFLREDGVLFRSAPTASDRFQRNILTLHELTHQWFGDLVTMRWFDDLWLKEGFAQYMAYRAVDALEPKAEAWKHFYEDIKPQAYGIDETEGTTPIFQDIPNLNDAKSAYGAIVYQKAPAILKQLEFRLGAEPFRKGLRLYLQQHAYGNAQWSDLIAAFHASSGQDVRTWADAWVLRRGMPEVNISWACDAEGKLQQLELQQADVLNDGFVWPISDEVILQYGTASTASRTYRVDWSQARVTVKDAEGARCPQRIFANAGDEAYGRYLLDTKSEDAVRRGILQGTLRADNTDPLLRSELWGALWDRVHVAQSPPRNYVDLVLANLPDEPDETLARIQGSHATTALQRYLPMSGREAFTPRLEDVLKQRMLTAPAVGLRIISFRALTAVTETAAGRSTLKDLLAGQLSVPGVELRPLDRWNLVGKLIALHDPEAMNLFATESKRDRTDDGQKYAWAVQAGAPDPATKAQYFNQYLQPPSEAGTKPEDWLTQSLRPFNAWNQSALTEPFLARALAQLPEIKHDRKIFFLGAWLSAFLEGQMTPQADVVVQQWLAQPGIDADLRRKVLENVDELERTVRIRERFPQ